MAGKLVTLATFDRVSDAHIARNAKRADAKLAQLLHGRIEMVLRAAGDRDITAHACERVRDSATDPRTASGD